ncbi:MAG: MFS transporter, partial [Geodermatophilaceae bacterium]
PIGRPVANTRLHVLDRDLLPVPVGVAGELFLAGVGLARGYLHRPGLTADRFVPDPFGVLPGGRLYRTGDVARFRADGAVEFLGRADGQVKVRGFRIELGEIEARLRAHPGVGQAVVAALSDAGGGRRLVGYLVSAGGGVPGVGDVPAVEELRAWLGATLPEYMVPSVFVVVERLPLTPNGKLDRRALPAPEVGRSADVGYRAPSSPVELSLAAIWAEVLGVDRVGLDDNFFDLGGHSLLAMRVVSRANKELATQGVAPLSVLDMFSHPTVAALVGPTGADGGRSSQARGLLFELTRPVPADKRAAALVCVPYGGGSAVVFKPLADALPEGYSLYALALPGHDPGLPAEQALGNDDVASRCADELMDKVEGPLILYGHCLGGGALTVALAQQLEARGREVTSVFLGASFPSTRLPGRLFRAMGKVFKPAGLIGNRTYYHLLKAIGGFTESLSNDELQNIMRVLRHDVSEAEKFFAGSYADPPPQRLRAPIVSIVVERDPTTEFHEERYREWLHFSESVALMVLPGSDHYFINSRAMQLAGILTAAPAQSRPDARVVTPAPAEAQEPSRLASLKIFSIVTVAQLVSMIGSGLTGFALGIWVYLETGSLTTFALVEMFALLPGVLLAPLVGAVVDRRDRRTVMLTGTAVAGVCQAAMALLAWRGSLGIVAIYLLLSISSVAGMFERIAFLSAIPQIAPKRYLGRLNGMLHVAIGIAQTVAPLLAVALLSTVGLKAILTVDAATFAVVTVVLLLVRFPRTLPNRRRESLQAEIRYGLRYVVRSPALRGVMIYFAALSLLTAPLFLLVTPLVLPFGSVSMIGQMFVAAGVGSMLGGLLMGLWGGPKRLMAGVLGSSVLGGLGMVAMGLRPSILLVAAGFFLWVVAIAVFNGCYATIIQLKVPQALQGRVFAVIQMTALGIAPIAYLGAGPLGEHVFEPLMAPAGALAGTVGAVLGTGAGRGVALMYILAGLGVLVATALAYRSRAIWQLEDVMPDALPDDTFDETTPPPPSDYFVRPAPDLGIGGNPAGEPARALSGLADSRQGS